MLKKILIANRGEIAVRIIRTCKVLGIKTVAIYSKGDKNSLHVQLADESICIGPSNPMESYLNIEKIISAAIVTKSDGIHPGFGFLSESADFANLCSENNIIFIGPNSKVIDAMGNKSKSRNTMVNAGIPVVEGSEKGIHKSEEGKPIADKIGYPVIVKASSGGGGKGMRIIEKSEDFHKLFNIAQVESVNAFKDNTMYVEKYVRNPKHIEVQILGDKYGNIIHLGERDCSVQRNHQKMIEESPCLIINEETRKKLCDTAVKIGKLINYENAGTIEFIMDEDFNFYFIEMNTRIQVEHPVTEMITGVDLIKEQIKIASGQKLSYKQEDINLVGHSIECRINAENPAKNFMPCAKEITHLHFPGGNGVRVDSHIYSGYKLPLSYDSMIGKIIVHGNNRQEAIEKMKVALDELVVGGVETNVDFQYSLMNNSTFISGKTNTGLIEELMKNN